MIIWNMEKSRKILINNKLWYFAFYYWNSPNSTDVGNAWLVVMTMVEGVKKENKKRILLGGKQTQTFLCLIPSLTRVKSFNAGTKSNPMPFYFWLWTEEKETGIKI